MLNQLENVLDFSLYLLILCLIKFNKVIFVEDYFSIHSAKLSLKITFSKFRRIFSIAIAHLIQLGKQTHLSGKDVTAIIDQTAEALSHWEELAETFGVEENNIKLIKDRMVI
ncbi:hypothetical protein [uncultured Imperialibacter sp.]|uniref:hypothetical protein n=1 Tax=uncultured Imperialibacter sp. TaxID=1672639 RepID=UPI0030D80502